MADDLLDLDQVAVELRVSRRTVERNIADGQIAAFKIRTRVYVERTELNDFMSRQRAEARRTRATRAKAARRRAA